MAQLGLDDFKRTALKLIRGVAVLLTAVMIPGVFMPQARASLCSSIHLRDRLTGDLRLNSLGTRMQNNPRLVEAFRGIELERDAFDNWFDSQTDFGKRALEGPALETALTKNDQLIAKMGQLATELGIQTNRVTLKDYQDIPETRALEIANINHPYFRDLKKEFPDLLVVWDPLRSFLLGGLRGSTGGSPVQNFVHLYDFPLPITDRIIHEILIHEVSHLKWNRNIRLAGPLFKTGKAVRHDGAIVIRSSSRPPRFYPRGFSWDEYQAYVLSVELALRYYRFAQMAKNLDPSHPLHLLLNLEAAKFRVESRLKILEDLIDVGKRVMADVRASQNISESIIPFDTGIEKGFFHITRKDPGLNQFPLTELSKMLKRAVDEKDGVLKEAERKLDRLKVEWQPLRAGD